MPSAVLCCFLADYNFFRSMEKKPSQITVSMPKELLEFIERRSGELGIGRAQLIVQYIRSDMNNEGKPLVVIPTHKERGL